MKLEKELEEKVKAEAIRHLERGKPGWDTPHTLASVYWMRQLIKGEGGDERILVTAIYLHDIGYSPKFKKDYTYEEVKADKHKHMVVGAREAEKILRKLHYSSEEIKEIVHLVGMHDKLDEVKTSNDILVMEADSLAQIDRKRVKPTFNREDYIEYIKDFEKERAPRFKTETGKKHLKLLLMKAKAYFT